MARVDRDRRYIRWQGMALGCVALVVLFCVSMHWVRTDIAKLQAQDTTLQYSVSVMEMEYADLLLQLQRVGSEGYVENEAREKYDFIRQGEIVFEFEFPERPGALMMFLEAISDKWNITLFHYRNHGADHGRVLAGLQVPVKERQQFVRTLKTLGYAFKDVTDNPAYRLFLGNRD